MSRARRSFALTRLEPTVLVLVRRDMSTRTRQTPVREDTSTNNTSLTETDITIPGNETRPKAVPKIRHATRPALIHEQKKEQSAQGSPRTQGARQAIATPIEPRVATVEVALTGAVRETAEERETCEAPSSFLAKTLSEC